MKSEILVQCEHLTKIFPGKKALDDVNLKIYSSGVGCWTSNGIRQDKT